MASLTPEQIALEDRIARAVAIAIQAGNSGTRDASAILIDSMVHILAEGRYESVIAACRHGWLPARLEAGPAPSQTPDKPFRGFAQDKFIETISRMTLDGERRFKQNWEDAILTLHNIIVRARELIKER